MAGPSLVRVVGQDAHVGALQDRVPGGVGSRPLLQLGHSAPEALPAVVQDEDLVGEDRNVLHQVGGKDDGGLGQLRDELAELDALGGVEAGGGLVEEEEPGPGDDDGGEHGALDHAP